MVARNLIILDSTTDWIDGAGISVTMVARNLIILDALGNARY